MNIIKSGKIVIDKEIQSLNNLKDNLGSSFAHACKLIASTKGKIVFLGLGKSGHVAKNVLQHFPVWEPHPFLFMLLRRFTVI